MLSNRDRSAPPDWQQARLGGPRRPSRVGLILRRVNWEIFIGFIVVLGFLTYVLWQAQEAAVTPATIAFLLVGWVFSLCLHEFAHAATAVLGGDTSESTLTYVSFNPLRYVNPFLSIVLPIIFIFLGGIGLPGGAVYLNRNNIRSRGMQSLVSLMGPAMNALCAVLLMLPFLIDPNFGLQHYALAVALALLAFFEVFAVVLNLLPIPPLDGFGVISPFLAAETQVNLAAYGMVGLVIIFALLWLVPPFNAFFFSIISGILSWGHIDPLFWHAGLQMLRF